MITVFAIPKSRAAAGLRRAVPGLIAAVLFAVLSCQSPSKNYEVPADVLAANKTLADGWQKLWGNEFVEAYADFENASRVLKNSAEAYRGMGLARFARGEVFEAADSFMKAIQLDPADPANAVARRFVEEVVPYEKQRAEKLFSIDSAIIQSRLNTTIGRVAADAAAEYYKERIADPQKIKDLTGISGYVVEWSILGPFPNGSGEGYERAFIEETSSSAQTVPAAPYGTKPWKKLDSRDPLGRVTLGERLSPNAASAIYASAVLSVAKDSDYRFILDTEGAVKLWVDGELVYADADYAAGNNQGWIEKKLTSGKHRLLIKLAERQSNSWFRLSALPFQPTQEKTGLSFKENGIALLDGVSPYERDPATAMLAFRLQAEGRSEDAFWLAWHLLDLGQIGGLENEIFGILPANPRKLTILASLPAKSSYRDWLTSAVHSSRQRHDDARNVFVRSVGSGSSFVPAYDYLIDEAADDSRLSEMDRLITTSNLLGGVRFSATLARFRLALLRDNAEEARKYLESLKRSWPNTSSAVLLTLAQNPGAVDSFGIAAQLRQLGLNFQANFVAMNAYENGGDAANSYKMAQLLSTLDPNDKDLRKSALEYGLRADKISPTAFIDGIEEIGEQYPGSYSITHWVLEQYSNLWTALDIIVRGSSGSKMSGQLKDILTGLDKLRITYAERELTMNPSNFQLRTELSKWKQATNPNNLAQVDDPLSIVSGYLVKPPVVQGDAQVLNDDVVEMHFEDGGYHSIRGLAMRVNTVSGVRNESTQYINGRGLGYDYKVLTAYSIKPDGSRVRAVDGNWSVNFPGLAAGDYLVLVYVVDGARTGELTPYVWTSFPLNGRYPVVKRSYKMYYPDSKDLKVAKHRADTVQLTETDIPLEAGIRVYSIDVENAKPVDWNLSFDDPKDLYAWIDASSVPDWAAIARWYSDIAYGRSAPTPAIRQKAAELTRGLSDRNEIIQRLFAYSASAIAYEDLDFQYSAFVPQWAESVASDGFGDCKDKCTLFLSLLEAVGIKGEIALSEPDYAGDNYYLPSPRFSHVITFIGEGKDRIVLDPTSDLLTFPKLPSILTGTSYLRIPRGTTENATLERLEASQPERSDVVIKLSPEKQSWNVQGNFTLRGDHAGYLREIAETTDPATQKLAVLSLINAVVPGIALDSYELDISRGLSYNPVLNFTGNVDRMQGNDAKISFIPNWLVTLPGGLSTRVALKGENEAFDLRYPQLDTAIRQTWIVGVPDGYKLGQAVNQELKFGNSYAIHRGRVEGKNLIQEREVYMPSGRVPSSEVEAFAAFFRRAALADRQPDIFEKL